jgi:hypothetical protein
MAWTCLNKGRENSKVSYENESKRKMPKSETDQNGNYILGKMSHRGMEESEKQLWEDRDRWRGLVVR